MTEYDDYGIPADAYSEPESLTHQAWRVARAFALYRVKPELSRTWNRARRREWSLRRVLSVVNVLIVAWWVAVYMGERSAIWNAVDACSWEKWESWVRIYIQGRSTIGMGANRCIGGGRKPASAHLRRRPAAHRSAYLPRSPVAAE